jgi:hypothetical protein
MNHLRTAAAALVATSILVASTAARAQTPAPVSPPLPPPPATGYAPYGYAPYGYAPYAPVAPREPEMKRRSTGLMAGGIVVTSLGALTALAGGIVYAGATKYELVDCGIPDVSCATAERRDDSAQQTAGMITMIGGIAMIGAGIPMIIIGAKKVPVTTAQVQVGPRSVGLRGTF